MTSSKMRELVGPDIFDQIDKADCICIPTNCSVLQNGENPMGALAGAAAARWDEVPRIYGKLLLILPNVPVIIGYISKSDHSEFISSFDDTEGISSRTHTALVALPTMIEIGQPADINLVKRSAQLLAEMADLFYWKDIYTGRIGCGVGGLDYDTEVKPLLNEIFDNRFVVMHKELFLSDNIELPSFSSDTSDNSDDSIESIIDNLLD